MLCADTDVWNVAAFLPMARKLDRWTLRRDARLEAEIIKRCGDWWEDHVVQRKAPPTDGSASCTAGLVALFPTATDRVIAAEPEDDEMIAELVAANDQIKALTAQKKTLINALTAKIGDDKGIAGASGALMWSTTKAARRLDAKRLKAEDLEMWEKYAKTGKPGRMARIVAPKEDK